ncbi:right-handed parallel beta-helix repeat-containing protein [Planctomonas psychrotolerans]|uniref:right-handed parallel beta-helix repeat-containing protein n=1 Tax=Planctomonas psychrotolerans TaxID=2528712 RepID=UPI00123A1181|nr:right-handed parallel beta-helix repeat-containing protein [Planctomonas psychrotolerans]
MGANAVVTALASGLLLVPGPGAASPAGTYENGSPAVSTSGSWSTVHSGYDSGGSYIRLDSAGAAEITFTGSSVKWVSRTNNYAGIADVYLDGTKVQSVDLYSAATAYRTVAFDSGSLPDGQHTLRIAHTGQKNSASTGSNIFLDSVIVEDDPTDAVGPGTYENGAAAIVSSGPWSTVTSGQDSGGSAGRLDSVGAATLTFTGTGVTWLTRMNDYAGIAEVFLDGARVKTVDLYSEAPKHRTVAFDSGALAAGTHTLRIERTGLKGTQSTGKNIFLDAIVVEDATPAEAPVDAPAESVAPADTAARTLGTSAVTTTAVTTAGTQDSTSGALGWTGKWTQHTSSRDMGGSYRVSGDASAAVRLSFTGTGVKYVTRTDHYSGIARVLIDGRHVRDVDLYTATRKDQQTVFSASGLSAGTHTMVIERTGAKNPSSTGRDISLDALVVTDSTPPPAPAAPSISANRKGLALSWATSTAHDVKSYKLYRALGSGSYSLVQAFTPSQRSILDVGLNANASYSYRLTAIDSSGNESARSAPATAKTVPAPTVSTGRYAKCPAATMSVSTRSQLATALTKAAPGSVIKLAAGNYGGGFNIAKRGTKEKPIWICGPRTAVLDGGNVHAGHGVQITNSSHVVLTGMTIKNSKKGVMVVNSTAITVSDLSVTSIGEEAIHLRTHTTDSFVMGNVISRTGLRIAQYGEGVYIGSDPSNWCNFSGCQPDRSNRNSVLYNTISKTTAEAIEAKPGSQGGLIKGNTVEGSLINSSFSTSWISVSGNDYIVERNTGVNSPRDGIKSVKVTTVAGWGVNNVFVGNSATSVRADSYGVRITSKYTNALVGCDNTLSGSGMAPTNQGCQK